MVAVTNINPPIIPSLSFYSTQKIPLYFLCAPGMIDPNWNRPIEDSKDSLLFTDVESLGFGRLWIISCDGGARSGQLDEHSRKVKEWLEARYVQEFLREFDGLWLFRYTRFKSKK